MEDKEKLLDATVQNNIRIYPEDKEAFAQYCKDKGIKAADAFKKAVDALETEVVKQETPGRATEIAEVAAALELINNKYVDSIRYANATEERIRAEFVKKLDSKDQSIVELQDKVKELQEKVQEAKQIVELAHTTTTNAVSEKDAAVTALEELRTLTSGQLADKETIISTLNTQLASVTAKAEGWDSLKQDLDTAKEQFRELEEQFKEHKRDAESTLRDTLKDAEIAQRDAVREATVKVEQEMSIKIENLRTERDSARSALEIAKKDAEIALKDAKSELEKELRAEFEAKLEALRVKHAAELKVAAEDKQMALDALRDKLEEKYNNNASDNK